MTKVALSTGEGEGGKALSDVFTNLPPYWNKKKVIFFYSFAKYDFVKTSILFDDVELF